MGEKKFYKTFDFWIGVFVALWGLLNCFVYAYSAYHGYELKIHSIAIINIFIGGMALQSTIKKIR